MLHTCRNHAWGLWETGKIDSSKYFGVLISGGKGRLGPCPDETVPCSACPTGTQLWITDVHTEDVEETFYSRIDEDVWFLLQFNIFLIATKDAAVFTCCDLIVNEQTDLTFSIWERKAFSPFVLAFRKSSVQKRMVPALLPAPSRTWLIRSWCGFVCGVCSGCQGLCCTNCVCSQPQQCWWLPAPRWTRAEPPTMASRRCTTWQPAGRAPWCSCVSTPPASGLVPSTAPKNKILWTNHPSPLLLWWCFTSAGRCCVFLGWFGFFSVAEFSCLW